MDWLGPDVRLDGPGQAGAGAVHRAMLGSWPRTVGSARLQPRVPCPLGPPCALRHTAVRTGLSRAVGVRGHVRGEGALSVTCKSLRHPHHTAGA